MKIYLYIGGAYGDDYWFSTTPPSKEQMDCWKSGELLVFMIDSDMRAFSPDGAGGWTEVRKVE